MEQLANGSALGPRTGSTSNIWKLMGAEEARWGELRHVNPSHRLPLGELVFFLHRREVVYVAMSLGDGNLVGMDENGVGIADINSVARANHAAHVGFAATPAALSEPTTMRFV